MSYISVCLTCEFENIIVLHKVVYCMRINAFLGICAPIQLYIILPASSEYKFKK